MLVQDAQRHCSNLTYRIYTSSKKEVMVLAVKNNLNLTKDYLLNLKLDHRNWSDNIQKVLMHDLTVPAYVDVNFLNCPTGFQLSASSGECVCSTTIRHFVTDCFIDESLIRRKPSNWIGIVANKNNSHQLDNSPTQYLTHHHCPFDYCRPGTYDFSLDEPNTQCSHNRSGILCGRCEPGYSLVLGATECRKCSNVYLLLLVPFAMCGIGLIVLLSLTDMTVATGTLNGLLFYANILTDNKAAFFPSAAEESFLSVFIAWLSLDFGITCCFFDGLDAYSYTWLQLLFPIYIWLLTLVIIIACRHITFVSKLCGSNIVPVLATLFLLSYTKLLRTITTSLSFTVVGVSDGKDMLVWLKDGNVPYLQGKHIGLFVVNFVFLLILLAYTVSIMLGPWLQRKTQYRVFCWVLKLKPLFDAYYGPLKDQHRYWTGVLLFARIILGLVSAVNVLGDQSINLLAVTTTSFVLLSLLWQSGGAYKIWAFSLLDCFFLTNLGILSAVTLFDKLSSGASQYVAVYASIASAGVLFLVVILYHCFKRCKIILNRAKPPLLEAPDETDSDDNLLDAIDENR